jgi:carotenoid cleavage dioxygenase-like enzyme
MMPLPESLFSARISDLDLYVTSGTMPEGIHGEMVISAPLIDDRLSYQLFGFGALLRLSLTSGTFGAPAEAYALRHRVIDTPVYRLHQRAPEQFKSSLLGFETPWGAPNMANTAPLAYNGRLLATWDVGRPVEVDPITLGFIAEIGRQQSWGGGSFGRTQPLPQVFSSAHPVVDPERGWLWTVKLVLSAQGMQPWVVKYRGDGGDVSMWPIEGAAVLGSMHTIAQTRNWLVMADSGNFKADLGEIMGGTRTVMIDETVPVYLVRKEDVESTPPGEPLRSICVHIGPTTGHYYAVWDDSDGIRVLFEHMDLTDLGYRLQPGDVDAFGQPINPAHYGMYQMAMASQTISEWIFDPATATARRSATASGEDRFNLQLSAQDWSIEGQSDPTHHHVVFQGFRGGGLSQRTLNVYSDRIERNTYPDRDQVSSLVTFGRGDLNVLSEYRFPTDHDLPSSPSFVPRRGGVPGGGDGWVVLPVLSDDGFRVEVFDAADVGFGPVATLAPRRVHALPFILHSIWMPGVTSAPDVDRNRFSDDLDTDLLGQLDPTARDLILAVAAELNG